MDSLHCHFIPGRETGWPPSLTRSVVVDRHSAFNPSNGFAQHLMLGLEPIAYGVSRRTRSLAGLEQFVGSLSDGFRGHGANFDGGGGWDNAL